MLKVLYQEIGEKYGLKQPNLRRKIKMTGRSMTGDCSNCESTYTIDYMEELVAEELPEYCPFCGEPIEELSEDYIEDDDDSEDDGKWD